MRVKNHRMKVDKWVEPQLVFHVIKVIFHFTPVSFDKNNFHIKYRGSRYSSQYSLSVKWIFTRQKRKFECLFLWSIVSNVYMLVHVKALMYFFTRKKGNSVADMLGKFKTLIVNCWKSFFTYHNKNGALVVNIHITHRLIFLFRISICTGWYSYSRCFVHEPKAPATLHKEDSEKSRGRSGYVFKERRKDDSTRSIPVYESNNIRSQRRHARRSRSELSPLRTSLLIVSRWDYDYVH